MNVRDLVNIIRPETAVEAQAISATTNGAAIDVTNASKAAPTSLTFAINVGTFSAGLDGSNKITVSFQKDDNSGFSSPVAVPASDIFGALRSDNAVWDLILDDATDEGKTFRVGVKLNDPANGFYRAVLTVAGTVSGFIAADAVVTPDFSPEA